MRAYEKPVDTLRMMRSIDEKTRRITFDEQQAYIQERLRSWLSDPASGTDAVGFIPIGPAGAGIGKA